MAMVYSWRPEAHVKIDAQKAGEAMERLRVRQNGRLESKDVVKAAKPETSPLHAHFEWNDQKAAEAYRVTQAGYLIRSIQVEVEKPSGEVEPIRAFVSVVRDEDRSYTSVEHAMSDDDLRQQVVVEAWKELQSWRKRHAELVEFAKVFSVVDKTTIGLDLAKAA